MKIWSTTHNPRAAVVVPTQANGVFVCMAKLMT